MENLAGMMPQSSVSSSRGYGPDISFWSGKKVFVTGHTGFKGSWLTYWLSSMGAKVYGYSLSPATSPCLFELLALRDMYEHEISDICSLGRLKEALQKFRPEIVLHLAAQPLVIASYQMPVETFETNVQGTVNLLQACRAVSPRAIVVVTTDKCYLNRGSLEPYGEDEPLAGDDPYSASKACAELVVRGWRNSFFTDDQETILASARAGNIFGGGDWGEHRIIPDAVKAFAAGETLIVRNPESIRPWQHVMAPLCGYLLLVEHMYKYGHKFSTSFNFGPADGQNLAVRELLSHFARSWGGGVRYQERKENSAPHEASYLSLNSTRARTMLNWHPSNDIEADLFETADLYKLLYSAPPVEKARRACLALIERETQTKQPAAA